MTEFHGGDYIPEFAWKNRAWLGQLGKNRDYAHPAAGRLDSGSFWPLKQMLHRMPPLSFPSFGEDSCSGGKSLSATSCDASPSALPYKISEPACRLWFFLTGRSTGATSFLFFFPLCNARPNLISGAYCRARPRPLQIAVLRLGRRRLLDKIRLDERAFAGLLVKNRLSDNVGGVKHFLSVLPRALRRARHFALVEKQLPVPTKARW